MKFDCGEDRETKRKRKEVAKRLAFAIKRDFLESEHTWFAWFPVRVGKNDCRWLENVTRVGKFYESPVGYCGWNWSYYAKTY